MYLRTQNMKLNPVRSVLIHVTAGPDENVDPILLSPIFFLIIEMKQKKPPETVCRLLH